MADQWVQEVDNGPTQIWNLNGVPWFDAVTPPRKHECIAQTKGYVDWFTPVVRCACGAIQYDGSHWMDKNQRLKETPMPAVTKRKRWWRR
jgi:hypothetical protein